MKKTKGFTNPMEFKHSLSLQLLIKLGFVCSMCILFLVYFALKIFLKSTQKYVLLCAIFPAELWLVSQ